MPTNRGEAVMGQPPVEGVSRSGQALQGAELFPGQRFGLVTEKRMAHQLTHGLENHCLREYFITHTSEEMERSRRGEFLFVSPLAPDNSL